MEAVGCKGVDGGTFDDFEVAKGGKIEAEVLECVGGLVYEEDIYEGKEVGWFRGMSGVWVCLKRKVYLVGYRNRSS